MIKPFTNKKGESYLFVEVPEDAVNFIIRQNSIQANLGYNIGDMSYIGEELPQGNYQLIGLAKDVSEEQADLIVEKHEIWYTLNLEAWIDYTSSANACVFPATESLSSLVQSLGLNNPIIFKLIK